MRKTVFIPKTLKAKTQINGKAGVMQCSIFGEIRAGKIIIGQRYREIAEKRSEFFTENEAIIYHHDNARPHVKKPFKNYLGNFAPSAL